MPETLLPPEQQDRADLYALLAALLLGPDDALLEALAAMPHASDGASDLALGWDALIDAAGRCGSQAQDEFDALFTGSGPERMDPSRRCYVDEPLADLREDLRQLGLARRPGVLEAEDHLGALCEAMRVLVQRGEAEDRQQAFFRKHLHEWPVRCCDEIATRPGADFYRAVAGLARAFFVLEMQDGPAAESMIDGWPPSSMASPTATR